MNVSKEVKKARFAASSTFDCSTNSQCHLKTFGRKSGTVIRWSGSNGRIFSHTVKECNLFGCFVGSCHPVDQCKVNSTMAHEACNSVTINLRIMGKAKLLLKTQQRQRDSRQCLCIAENKSRFFEFTNCINYTFTCQHINCAFGCLWHRTDVLLPDKKVRDQPAVQRLCWHLTLMETKESKRRPAEKWRSKSQSQLRWRKWPSTFTLRFTVAKSSMTVKKWNDDMIFQNCFQDDVFFWGNSEFFWDRSNAACLYRWEARKAIGIDVGRTKQRLDTMIRFQKLLQ